MTNPNGGPRTQQGKNVSSRNAIKVGLYSNSLLEGEDPDELEALRASLVEQWGLEGTQGELMARDFVYCELKTTRLQQAQVAMIESHMYTQDTRREFGKQAGFFALEFDKLPDWYFGSDDGRKAQAVILCAAVSEAHALKSKHSLQAVLQARTLYPHLWKVVMGPNAINPNQTLGEKLLARFGKSTPEANLQAFIDHHKEVSKYEIRWGVSRDRFEAILRGLRAKFEMEVLCRADWAKVENSQHRKRLELTQMAHTMRREQSVLVELSSPLNPSQPKTLGNHEAASVSTAKGTGGAKS
ncbi:hypothetical protein B9Z35_06070 [Limnohabitans sp. Jir61]|uniref:hypothetical protein n=1 Tax=Limnohabitans sp. Jir61 TaxID=1826168 RepID=UPI000D3D6026|nr:hypothetical protein [Limnohabitans sp. Jir61]PUE33085.1 hypothetical protein B9Z35_06070 [Limnohabitans sp. Jir61]